VYRAAAEELLATCQQRDLGVMIIKAAARRPWADRRPLTDVVAGDAATSDRWATSWYEPQPAGDALRHGISFALSVPGVHAFCTPGDIGLLPDVLDAADNIAPMTATDRDDAANTMAGEAHIFPIPR
jgi:hypothetical protein